MTLNKYRYVDYVEDGHCSYQCLKCYRYFSTGDMVGYKDCETGECTYYWHYCPCCGTKWDGCHRWEGEYGPRRQRVMDALRSAMWRPPKDRYRWVMEEQAIYSWYEGEQGWTQCFWWPARTSAHEVYRSYQQQKELRLYHKQDEIDDGELVVNYRVRLTTYHGTAY